MFQYLPLVPYTEFYQTKRTGHHQQAIDEIRALGLGTATPMATMEAEVASTMVCRKRVEMMKEGGKFFCWQHLPKQRQFAYLHIAIGRYVSAMYSTHTSFFNATAATYNIPFFVGEHCTPPSG